MHTLSEAEALRDRLYPPSSEVVPCAECVYAHGWCGVDPRPEGFCRRSAPGLQYPRLFGKPGTPYTGWPQIGHDEGCGAGVRRQPAVKESDPAAGPHAYWPGRTE